MLGQSRPLASWFFREYLRLSALKYWSGDFQGLCQAQIGEISTGGQCRCCFPGMGTGGGISRDALCLIQSLNSEGESTAVLGF